MFFGYTLLFLLIKFFVLRRRGTVKLFGKEMRDTDTDIREKIGVVYDGDNFPGFWSAKQLSQVMEGIYTQWDRINLPL